MITKVINVNLHQPIYERLTAKQGDIASRYLLFHLLDGDKPFDLNNRSVRVYAIKPDKTEIFNDLIINDKTKGYCTLELTSQCLASAGVVKMELYISESGKVLTSIPFELEVIACINTANGVVSTNEFSALEAALVSLQDYNNLRSEIVQARKGYTTVGKRLDNFDSQLEHIENKQGDFINLKNYCVGDGVADDTANFFKALEYAKLNKLAVLVDGKFLIKRKITIENNTIPKLYGVNKNISKIIFDMTTIQDEALKVETNYITSLIIEDVGFETTTPVIKNFLNLNAGGWGSQIKMFNCSVDGFGGNILELTESFQCTFDNCAIIGVSINNVKEGVLLKINRGNTFSNQNTFYNCLFANAKIGIQNLGGIKYVFDSCTFTGLTLFMNCPILHGLDQLQDFKNCWFESITKGILNCEIDSCLNPINIDSTKSDLKNMHFCNNQIADTPAMTFDVKVEPVLAPKSQYYLMNGWNIKVNNLEVFEEVPILSDEWDGVIKVKKTSYDIVTLKGSITPKTNTPTQLGVICNIGDKKPDNNHGFLATDSPNGGVSAKFMLASNGNLIVPFGETYNSSFTYNFYFSYQI